MNLSTFARCFLLLEPPESAPTVPNPLPCPWACSFLLPPFSRQHKALVVSPSSARSREAHHALGALQEQVGCGWMG